jgi:hypothetical protein
VIPSGDKKVPVVEGKSNKSNKGSVIPSGDKKATRIGFTNSIRGFSSVIPSGDKKAKLKKLQLEAAVKKFGDPQWG